MKLRSAILLFLAAVAVRAEWSDLRPGMTPADVQKALGRPLIEQASRNGTMRTWFFDHGAYVFFDHQVVWYWKAPAPRAVAVAKTKAQGGAVAQAHQPIASEGASQPVRSESTASGD